MDTDLKLAMPRTSPNPCRHVPRAQRLGRAWVGAGLLASLLVVASPATAQRQAPPPLGAQREAPPQGFVPPPQPATPAPVAPATPAAAAATAPTADEASVITRINALRAEAGLAPLAVHAGLTQAARVHSQEMARTGALTHVSTESGSPADRVRAAGVQPLRVTENVSSRQTAVAAHDAILASPPHRAQLLDATITHVGVGVATGARGVFITEVMARLAPQPTLPPPAVEDVTPPSSPEAAEPQPVQPQQPQQPEGPQRPTARPTPQRPPQARPAQPRRPARVAPHSVTPAQGPAPRHRGTVPTMRLTQFQPGVAGYWLFHEGRWWYFPVPAGARTGQILRPDTRVTGAPPGYQQGRRGRQAQPAPPVRTRVPATTAPRGYWRLTPQ